MHYYEVAPTKIIRLNSTVLTYQSAQTLHVGQIVLIDVGKKQLVGIVMREVPKPTFETRPIVKVIESHPLPNQLLQLSVWLSQYYGTHLATVTQLLIPAKIQTTRRVVAPKELVAKRKRTNFLFNEEQSVAIQTVIDSKPGTFLLQGITGSGKTEVYIELARQTLASDRSAIILVPEIALTSQIVAEFSNNFKDIYVIHSSIGESQRHTIWKNILNSSEPVVVIGARSALFSPVRNLGLIVLDEAHESSYKQDQSPKYSALRAATMLGRFHESKVVLGSATPSIVDRFLSDSSDTSVLKLTKKATPNSIEPVVTVVDMTKREHFTKHRFLSNELLFEIESVLKQGKQALIFHNRRGSAHIVLCEKCGYTANCSNCFVPLTLHGDDHKLMCHICNHTEKVPLSCPVCNHANIVFKGFGTKLIESELAKLFPQARISRFDADNKAKDTLDANYDSLYKGEIDIAIGTQVVAKGLDLPHLRFVGVVQADSGLALPDFNSTERTFQLLAQVIGRVGRTRHKTNVVVQTYKPDHPSVAFGISQDYESFYQHALMERRKSLFPPFTHLLKLTCTYKNEASAIRATKNLSDIIRGNLGKKVHILGPVPAFYERRGESYRWQLIIKSSSRKYLIDCLKLLPPAHWQYDLDPTSLL